MSQHDDPNPDDVSTDSYLSRRNALHGLVALGTSATFLGASAGTASAHPRPHEIVVEALSDHVKYRIEVTGEIVRGEYADDDDEIRDGTVVVGKLAKKGDVDSFRFAGKVVDVEVHKGKAEVTVTRAGRKKPDKKKPAGKTKAREKKPDEEKKAEKDKKARLDSREISFHAHGPHVKYEFVVTGDVEPGEKSTMGTGSYIEDDVIHGNVASAGADNYHFTGEIEKFHVTDPDNVTVKIDGEEVDPLSLGEYGHIMIRAQGPHVKYEFTTTGTFEPGKESTMGTGSYIDNGTAYGNVAGTHGRDNYWFTGELTGVGVTDPDNVTVLVDGMELDPYEIG